MSSALLLCRLSHPHPLYHIRPVGQREQGQSRRPQDQCQLHRESSSASAPRGCSRALYRDVREAEPGAAEDPVPIEGGGSALVAARRRGERGLVRCVAVGGLPGVPVGGGRVSAAVHEQ